ncbi:phage tail tape measure protein [Vibrio alginolyticus]|uniref:phage tail tape measure protein n=1 Tax=Vibrio alginolyticus TaxID=663 RepID=UPI00215CA71D|nr:phage tail tape measure protein [Vibrio alginolyticus]EKA2635217.1 phage tail tape measure protein [Vibrio alginolyticus]MCR9350548.1 phage tail tape measure protein [Vibrio alginolyticus]MCR9359613.1 phage tail tape measure protein [Vibrio alginolyticus]
MSMEKLLMHIALVDQVTKPLQGITKEVQASMDAGKQGMQNMAAGGAGLVATGFAIQNALMPAIEMDRKLGEVKSLGVLDEDLTKLSKTALWTSVQYGKSATDIVGASYDIKSAFGDIDGDSLSDITKSSAVLAAATKADTATITDYMGTMYGVFKNQADEIGVGIWSKKIAGMTAQSVEMFKTTGAGMSSAFTSIGANATSAGVAIEEQMAILGTLQSTMSGSEAGTKYKAFLAGVANAQDKLNLSFTDSQGQMLPMLDILEQLKRKYGDTLSVAEAADLKKAFGSEEAVSMIKLLMADTEGLAGSIDQLGQIEGMSKAEQMASTMTDQWERLEAAWFAVRAAVFGAILPSINSVVGTMADGLMVLVGWTDQFPWLAEILGYVAIAGLSLGGVIATLSLAMGIGQMMSAGWTVTMTSLNSIMKLLRISTLASTAAAWLFNAALWANPLTWVVAGIALLIGGIAAAIYWWDDLTSAFKETAWFDVIAHAIEGLVDLLNMIPGVDIELGSQIETPEMTTAVQAEHGTPISQNLTPGDTSEVKQLELLQPQMSYESEIATNQDVYGYKPEQMAPFKIVESQVISQPSINVEAPNLDTQSPQPFIEYKGKSNEPRLPPQVVNNMKTTNHSDASRVSSFGDVYITAPNGITPDQLAEWDELNVG